MVDREINLDSWFPNYHNFGTIYWKDDPSVTFVYNGTKTIKSIETTCPCVQVKVDRTNGIKIHARWFPKQPDGSFYSSMKRIIIKYIDHTRDELTLQAVITK